MNGSLDILKWNDEPIACLTSNGIAETMSFLNTSKRTQLGALSVLPVAHSYQISFEAVMVSDMGMSWDELALLMRYQQIGSWEMTGVNQSGLGYLSNLELIANTGENITFTGVILGQGEIIPADLIQQVWYQDIDTYVDEGTKYVLVS